MRSCCVTPWAEVMLYISGAMFVTFGIGAMVVSIDPRPLDGATWRYFLQAGIGFLVLGAALLVLTAMVPESCFERGRYAFPISASSSADLLANVQSVGCRTPQRRGPQDLGASQDSLLTVRSCMMMRYPLSGSEGIRFYKETVI